MKTATGNRALGRGPRLVLLVVCFCLACGGFLLLLFPYDLLLSRILYEVGSGSPGSSRSP